MATRTKVVTNNVTTYTITDQKGNSATLTVTQTPGYAITTSYAGGPILPDGSQMMETTLQLVSTGLLP